MTPKSKKQPGRPSAAGKSKLLAGWAKRLTNLRLRLEMTPDEMAGELGLSEAAYLTYERNERSEAGPGWHRVLYALSLHESRVSINWIVLGRVGPGGRSQSRRPINVDGKPIPKGGPRPPTFWEITHGRMDRLEGQMSELRRQQQGGGLELCRIGNVVFPGRWHQLYPAPQPSRGGAA